MKPKKRLNKLINKLYGIDNSIHDINPVLENIIGGKCWGTVALIQDNNEIIHQDIDMLEIEIKDYETRANKFLK